jgi:hypothetical protein
MTALVQRITKEHIMADQPKPPAAGPVDLDEVAKLVAALERDLAGVKQGSGDLQKLRDEVRALGQALDAAPDHERVGHRLRTIHGIIDGALEAVVEDGFKAADYAGRIGRMLGL